MIPKKIHYCWFGGNPLPSLAEECIASWKEYCPDYEIIEWNESNFDINCCAYVKEAYEAKKWAFVTDYVRLYALIMQGGVYMDTDVEVVKSIDEFLNHAAFSGFERPDAISTGIMACEKDYLLFKKFLSEYDTRHFRKSDGGYDFTTNVVAITEFCMHHDLVLNNQKQVIEGFALYPNEYFCPKNYDTGIIESTDNTYTIHHYSSSWCDPQEIKWLMFGQKAGGKLGVRMGTLVGRVCILSYKLSNHIKTVGLVNTLNIISKKIFIGGK